MHVSKAAGLDADRDMGTHASEGPTLFACHGQSGNPPCLGLRLLNEGADSSLISVSGATDLTLSSLCGE